MALFRAHNAELMANVAATFVGMASIGGMSAATGRAADAILKVFAPTEHAMRTWPHLVLISVDRDSVRVNASNRRGDQGPLLATYHKGTFRAQMSRYPGEVDLTIDPDQGGDVWVRGKWGFFHHDCVQVAEAVRALAIGGSDGEATHGDTSKG